MEKKQSFKLIDGIFLPQEIGELLFAMINNKITFHNEHAFSRSIRFNEDATRSEKRVEELKKFYTDLEQLIQFATENNLKFKIKSDVEITLEK